jgi:Arc/MetJ-type ribon-helix-helix transcriptional regulator
MKVSVSLPDEDVEFLDTYALSQGIESRSAVVQKAIRLLRASELGPAYEDAWQEWSRAGEDEAWSTVAADGLV